MDVSEELRPAAVANRAANASNNTPDTDQLAANYDEKLKQMEKAQGKRFFEMGQNSEKELDRMSKQIQSGDEQNLELSESLRAAIEKTCRQQTATSRSFGEI
jgi:DNA anti-recombination protein RmuC